MNIYFLKTKVRMSIHIKNYFERIGFSDEVVINIETLEKLNFLHVTTIPFENINPFLELPVKIDIDSIQEKLIYNKRGGYCYEQNTLFFHVLTDLGFNVRPLAGRVIWNDSIDAITSLTHMFLLVTIDEIEYLVDVGFGAQTLTAPLEFVLNKEQKNLHESYQITELENEFVLQTRMYNDWKSMYRFNKNQQHFVDFEVGNWYTSTNPDFIFTKILFLSKVSEKYRFSLINTVFKKYDLNKKTETSKIESIEELKKIIENVFNLQLPKVTNLDEKLKKLF